MIINNIYKLYYNVYDEQNTFYITAHINDICNYNCEYCYNDFPRTNISLNLDNLFKFINHIYLSTKYNIKLEIIGGEPTLHQDLYSFCEKISLTIPNISVGIYTNGSISLNKIIHFLTIKNLYFIISWHYINKTQMIQFIDKCRFLASLYLSQINIMVMMEYKHFNESIYVFNSLIQYKNILYPSLLERTSLGNIIINHKPSSYTYTLKQLKIFKKLDNSTKFNKYVFTITYNKENNIIEKNISFNDVVQNYTSFYKWYCNVGKHYVFINFNGNIYKCIPTPDNTYLNTPIYNINVKDISNFQLPQHGVLCPKKSCPCIWEVSKKKYFIGIK